MPNVPIPIVPPSSSFVGGGANLAAAQAGNGASTNVGDRGGLNGPGAIRITTTVGATPTCTYAIEGSVDGVNFVPIPIADPATPQTLSVATFTITTAGTIFKYLLVDFPWRFVRVTFSANTNVTNTVDVFTA